MAVYFFDIETRSLVDLRKTGGKVYAEDPSTEVLCAVWIRQGDLETHVWCPLIPKEPRRFLLEAWVPEGFPSTPVFHWGPECPDLGGTWIANNGDDFDFHVWEALGLPAPDRTMDSIRYFRRASLPGGLDAVSKVVLGSGKHDGRSSMLRLSKPSKRGGFLPVSGMNMPPVVAYCIDDVDKMRRIWEEYLAPRGVITDRDDPCLEVDRKINATGIRIDLQLAERVAEVEEALKVHDADVLTEETEGKAHRGTLRSPKQFLEFVEAVGGIRLPNCRRQTLEKVRDSANCDPVVKKAIEARIGENRVTGRKMVRAIMASPKDGRVRGALAYASAQTWRWGGRKIQPQNLPSPKIGPAELETLHTAFEAEGATIADLKATVLSLTDDRRNAGDVLGSLTRGVIVPEPGRRFFIVDWSAIEARGLMWLVGDEPRLDMFRTGRDDPYKVFATDLFGVDYSEVTKRQRKVCKPAVLGAGYQIGGEKMEAYAQLMGVDLEEFGTTGAELVDQWRDLNPLVAGERTGDEYKGHVIREGGAWKDLQKGAEAVARGGFSREVCRCYMEMFKGDFVLTLPSGSRRIYPHARVEPVVPSWGGDARDQFVYDKTFGGRILPAYQYGGKWVENCLAGDTLVLTERGWVSLVNVTREDRVFDGVEWVEHSGLSYRGQRETGEWLGVWLTRDHEVLLSASWGPVGEMDDRRTSEALQRGWEAASWAHNEVFTRTTPARYWTPTGNTEPVYDILNAGPRQRFTVLTAEGPVIVHNCVQALCRDILADALVALDAAGFRIPLHVHDEIVCEEFEDRLEEMCEIMTRSPSWAPDFPLGVGGFVAPRYLKEPFPGATEIKRSRRDFSKGTQDGLGSDGA